MGWQSPKTGGTFQEKSYEHGYKSFHFVFIWTLPWSFISEMHHFIGRKQTWKVPEIMFEELEETLENQTLDCAHDKTGTETSGDYLRSHSLLLAQMFFWLSHTQVVFFLGHSSWLPPHHSCLLPNSRLGTSRFCPGTSKLLQNTWTDKLLHHQGFSPLAKTIIPDSRRADGAINSKRGQAGVNSGQPFSKYCECKPPNPHGC